MNEMQEEAFKRRFTTEYKTKYGDAEPTNFEALDFVAALGCVSDALLYSRLFLPEFIEIDGMIFLRDFVEGADGPKSVRKLIEEQGDPSEVERILNFFQVNLNLPNRVVENIEGDDHLLAEQLATAWTLGLRQRYPDREFVMQVLDEDGEASVCFYQKRIGNS